MRTLIIILILIAVFSLSIKTRMTMAAPMYEEYAEEISVEV